MMLEGNLKKGELTRLFPTLDSKKKEGRALSIFLFNMCAIYEFGKSLLNSVGVRVGKNAKLCAFTEITFKKPKNCADQPDGLLILRTGRSVWSALVEAKIGNNHIEPEQIERYLKLAKINNIDAVISISNEFAIVPEHPPYHVNGALTRTVKLFHWSWKNILTQSSNLVENDEVEDQDQELILKEFCRFLRHKSTGIQGIESMGSSWGLLIEKFVGGVRLSRKDEIVLQTSARWLQEVKDLELILSRGTSTNVSLKRSQKQSKDAKQLLSDTCEMISKEYSFYTEYKIPDASSNICVKANLKSSTLRVWMEVSAPRDKTFSTACVTWLLRQLKGCSVDNLFVEANWPGNRTNTQKSYSEVLDDPSVLILEDSKILPKSFRIMQISNETRKFRGTKTFVTLLERTVPDFYENVGQKLMSWQAPAPKIKNEEDIPDGIVE